MILIGAKKSDGMCMNKSEQGEIDREEVVTGNLKCGTTSGMGKITR